MPQKTCYIYTRVSTAIQVDGYSLDAQKDRLQKYASGNDLKILAEYSDAGRSGKSIEGRPDFKRMLNDIQNAEVHVDYVLVYKLSRFGRNAADVLNTLELMRDYNTNLICVEDGIDSSKDAGKLIISVLSSVAEIERENILVQTMAGRNQKASEGKWNGGFAPYGYKLVDGKLVIADDECEVIKTIYDKFVDTNLGLGGVAAYLNGNGYTKKVRQNGSLTTFSSTFVKSVIDNPVYAGKISYGRRKKEKITGTRNQTHVVRQKDYNVFAGEHEAIVSGEMWDAAQAKRKTTGVQSNKKYSLNHANILTGILKCPVCGANMYGNVNRKKVNDNVKDYFYYMCKHKKLSDGHTCTYSKQWSQTKIDHAVIDAIKDLLKNKAFTDYVEDKLKAKTDIAASQEELENLEKAMCKQIKSKARLCAEIDNLDEDSKNFKMQSTDLKMRLDNAYEKIADIQQQIDDVKKRIESIKEKNVAEANVKKFLAIFADVVDEMCDVDVKELLASFLESVEIYENQQEDGRILKSIKFRFPISIDEKLCENIGWECSDTVECCVLLCRK